jgi:hypothetical protein
MPRKTSVPPIPAKPAGRSKAAKPSRVDPKPSPPVQTDLWAAFADGWEAGEPAAAPAGPAGKPRRRRARKG